MDENRMNVTLSEGKSLNDGHTSCSIFNIQKNVVREGSMGCGLEIAIASVQSIAIEAIGVIHI